MRRSGFVIVVLVALIAVGLIGAFAFSPPTPPPTAGDDVPSAPVPDPPPPSEEPSAEPSEEPLPLAGRTVVIDPGHQLGNRHFPDRINASVPDGDGGRKACNTTGTSTDAGYPEATFTWQVAQLVRDELEALGAEVLLTREANSDDLWGPCVDERGEAGNALAGSGGTPAAVKVSIHADGAASWGSGFHVITSPVPAANAEPSLALARDLHEALSASFDVADYIAGGDGLDLRRDLGTLNHAQIPTVMVELGNMRNPTEAARMSSEDGRAAYAEALVAGLLAHLGS